MFRSAYGDRYSDAVLDCGSDGGAKQSFKEECDINNIMSRFNRTGVIDYVNPKSPVYGDATAFDLQNALNLVNAAEESFGALPAEIRKVFENDPVRFVAFCDDPANFDKGVELGIFQAPKLSEPASPVSAKAQEQPAQPVGG